MSRAPNFISFHDLSPEGRILWASPSIFDALGYELEELVGRCGYDIVYPEDYTKGKEFHKESFINDLVASQMVVRYRAKDGQPVHCLCVVSLCYDFAVNSVTILDDAAEAYLQQREYSPVMTRRVGSKKEEFERMRRHHDAFATNIWNQQMMEPEARVCLIINRYTRDLTVMYASSACEKVLCVDPDDLTGKPILLYIRADDLALFVEQMHFIKSSTAISQMRFWFQSPNCQQEIPCEAMILGAADGIMAIVRRCKPFVRKHLIGSREQFETRNRSSWLRWNQSCSSSLESESSAPSSSPIYDGYRSRSTASYRNVTRTALDRIRIFELDDEKDAYFTQRKTALSKAPAFKDVIVEHYEEEGDDDEHRDAVDRVVRGVAHSRLDDGHMEF